MSTRLPKAIRRINCDRKPFQSKRGAQPRAILRSTFPPAQRGPNPALTQCRTQATCVPVGSVVSLLGTRRDCSLRWRTSPQTERDRVHMPQGPPRFSHLLRRPSLSSRVYTGPKPRDPLQSARPSPQAPSCDLDDCERSKTSQVLADETGTLAQTPEPKEHKSRTRAKRTTAP